MAAAKASISAPAGPGRELDDRDRLGSAPWPAAPGVPTPSTGVFSAGAAVVGAQEVARRAEQGGQVGAVLGPVLVLAARPGTGGRARGARRSAAARCKRRGETRRPARASPDSLVGRDAMGAGPSARPSRRRGRRSWCRALLAASRGPPVSSRSCCWRSSRAGPARARRSAVAAGRSSPPTGPGRGPAAATASVQVLPRAAGPRACAWSRGREVAAPGFGDHGLATGQGALDQGGRAGQALGEPGVQAGQGRVLLAAMAASRSRQGVLGGGQGLARRDGSRAAPPPRRRSRRRTTGVRMSSWRRGFMPPSPPASPGRPPPATRSCRALAQQQASMAVPLGDGDVGQRIAAGLVLADLQQELDVGVLGHPAAHRRRLGLMVRSEVTRGNTRLRLAAMSTAGYRPA
jgi:hypothetical protein